MLSFPDPVESGVPHPTGNAPASSLAAPFIEPSSDRLPMDHDGVSVLDIDHNATPMAPSLLGERSDKHVITIAMLNGRTIVATTNPKLPLSR